jgi:hypothetical protein
LAPGLEHFRVRKSSAVALTETDGISTLAQNVKEILARDMNDAQNKTIVPADDFTDKMFAENQELGGSDDLLTLSGKVEHQIVKSAYPRE